LSLFDSVALAPAKHLNLGMLPRLVTIGALVVALFLALISVASAIEVKHVGTLEIPPKAQLFAFSTDPTVQQVLNSDFEAQRRNAGADAIAPLTVTVTVSERMLKPGVSLSSIAPGDPQVADLLMAVGATPPPIGDTGSQVDQAALSRHLQLNPQLPHDTPMEQALDQMQAPSELQPHLPDMNSQGYAPPPSPSNGAQQGTSGYTGDTQQYMAQGGPRVYRRHDDSDLYDTVVIARATISGKPGGMSVVALAHPGDDTHELKKLVAEEIANAILH
jgi:hypothetical protein